MAGELLTRGTAALVVTCWAARVLVQTASEPSPARQRRARQVWTLGCAAYLAHVAAAFGFYHGWSHEAAWQHTARITAETVGLDWGGGVYFNYLAAVLWPIDVWLKWRRPAGGRSRESGTPAARSIFESALLVYVGFLSVNATVVFGPTYWRWAAGAFAAVLLLALARRTRGRGQPRGA